MKKIPLLLLGLIVVSCSSSDDISTPDEELAVENIFVGIERITNQTELDEFGSQNYTAVEGTLILGNANPCGDEVPTLDLSPLSSITEIYQGGLIIEGARIPSLSGLSNLEYVGRIRLLNVWDLQNFEDLIGLQTIGNSDESFVGFTVTKCWNLESFSGLENVSFAPMDMIIVVGNESLSSLEGLENVTQVEALQISPTLGCTGPFINSEYSIYNENLTNFCALTNLVTNGTVGDFYIMDNPYNPTIEDFTAGNCSI